jgi:hypothetical protein
MKTTVFRRCSLIVVALFVAFAPAGFRSGTSILPGIAHVANRGLELKCLNDDPPCPYPQEPLTLQGEEIHHDVGWIFGPPPGGSEPPVSVAEALDLGWKDAAFASGGTVQPILALLPKGGTFGADTLVWVLRYDDACVPVHGPPELMKAPACGATQWNVILDASSGAFIAGYSDGPSRT